MIEEATGTRLYESKKEAAQRTIEKKDAKLREIDTILQEEITPTLTKLKEEQASYLEYQKVIRELEHLNRLYIAYQFVSAENLKKTSAEDLTKLQDQIEKLKNDQKVMGDKIKELDAVISELEKKRDQEAGGLLKKLEEELSEHQKADAKTQSALSHKEDDVKSEKKKLEQLEKQHGKDSTTIEKKKKDLEKAESSLKKLTEDSERDKDAHLAAQRRLQAVNAGLSSNDDGQDASLNNQLMAARREISNSETEIKQSQMKLKHDQQEMKKKAEELKQTEGAYKKEQQSFDALKKATEKLDDEIKKLNYEEGKEEGLLAERKRLGVEAQKLQEGVDKFEARFPQLQFEYKDPEKNFDRRSVHGLVANLVTIPDPGNATALEVAAGGKLYNVVVDTEQTGKKLLQKGELKRRLTIIPLNKISSRSIENEIVKKAETLVGKENVHTALSLVVYDRDLKAAMEFVFGSSFVCRDLDTAKKVTFDERILKRSVTLDGDSFDPAGTLTGGARQQTSSILLKLSELKETRDSLNQCVQKLERVEAELNEIRGSAAKWRDLKQQFDLKSQELKHLEEKLKQTSHGQQLEDIKTLQEEIAGLESGIQKAKELNAKATSRAAEIEEMLQNAGAVRERELKQAEAEFDRSRKAADQSNKKSKDAEMEVESIKLELLEMDKEIKTCENQVSNFKKTIAELGAEVEELSKVAEASRAKVSEAQTAVAKHKDLLKGCNREIGQHQAEQKRVHNECTNAQLKLQELEHKLHKCGKDSKEAAKQVELMLKEHSFILEERKYFGQVNTAYDFKANNPKETGHRIQKLQERKDKLSKSVNMRAMNMLGKAEEQYNDLMKKRKIVLNDKSKIASLIAELDEKKSEALKKAYAQVTRDFGSIFSTLLPGAQAKLVAPEGMTILDGLEFKVGFGDVWKESLSELSGGQRSLVALSLILALLLFNPAPLYILDEVDAALDLSHTQNIGQMLKTHFRSSQFIVVSLKDGMFNNANVLFKTKFVDGVSTVTRYVQNQSSVHNGSIGFRDGPRDKKAAKKPNKRIRSDNVEDSD